MTRAVIQLAICIAVYAGTAQAETKSPLEFRIVATSLPTYFLAVPKNATDEQITSLISSVKDAHKEGKLADLGLPPTTPRAISKVGKYGIVQLVIFREEKWATRKFIEEMNGEGRASSSQVREMCKHVAGYFYANTFGEYKGTLGMTDDGDQPCSKSYKFLFRTPPDGKVTQTSP